MSKTPVETSGLVNVRVASHLSNVPSSATDDFTKNLIEPPSGLIWKTGVCARHTDGNTANAKRQRMGALDDMVYFYPSCGAASTGMLGCDHLRLTLSEITVPPNFRALEEFRSLQKGR